MNRMTKAEALKGHLELDFAASQTEKGKCGGRTNRARAQKMMMTTLKVKMLAIPSANNRIIASIPVLLSDCQHYAFLSSISPRESFCDERSMPVKTIVEQRTSRVAHYMSA